MPLDFPPNYIEDAVNSAVTTYSRRVDILESDGETMWVRGADLVSGDVQVEMSRQERRTANLELFNDGRLPTSRVDGLWYDKVVKIYMGVSTLSGEWEKCIGTFLIDQIDSTNNDNVYSLKLRDFSKKLGYNISLPVSWPVNEPIEEIIKDLAIGGGIAEADMNLPTTGEATYEERSFSGGTVRFKAMYDLATAYGYDLYFDEDGILQMVEFTDPFTSNPQYTFEVTSEYSNLVSIGRNISDTLIFNHIVVEGEAPNGVPVWGEAFNQAPSSPTRIDRLGLRTKETIQNSWVITNEQARQVAERDLAYSSLERYEADLETLIVPWLDVNITVNFFDPKSEVGDPIRFLLNKLTINLDLSPASARVGRVTNVIEAPDVYPSTVTYPALDLFPSE